MATHPSDLFLPNAADLGFGDDWCGAEDEEAELLDAAAVRIQAARRGKRARSEAKLLKSGDHMQPSQTLTLELVKDRTSGVAPTADGMGFACSRLDASGLRLAGTLRGVSALRHLSTVDLSDNRLVSLSGLEGLPALSVLVCRRNRLLSVLDFPAPRGLVGSRLRHADLRNNAIAGAVSLPPSDGGANSRPMGVAAHGHLETLLVDDNKLRSLRGLASLPHLTQLSAASNQLLDTAGAEPLRRLTSLDLSRNSLAACDELGAMVSLRALHLAHNQIRDVPDLSALADLATLDVSHNALPSLEALAAALGHAASAVLGVPPLRELQLHHNSLESERPDLRLELLHLLPNLVSIDGLPCTAEEKTMSLGMHGDDSEALAAIRRDFFPDRLNTVAHAELPRLLLLYRAQHTAGFKRGEPLTDPMASRLAQAGRDR